MALQEQLASLVLVIGNMDAKALEMVPKGSLELMDAQKKAIEEGRRPVPNNNHDGTTSKP